MENDAVDYLYVLYYGYPSIIEVPLYDKDIELYNEDAEAIIRSHGYNPDECSWMFSQNRLEIQTEDDKTGETD